MVLVTELVVVFGTAELLAELVAELEVELEVELAVELAVLGAAKLGGWVAEPVAFPSYEALINICSALFAALAFDFVSLFLLVF